MVRRPLARDLRLWAGPLFVGRAKVEGGVEGGVLREDALVQRRSRWARLDPQLITQPGPQGPIEVQRLGLATAADGREHGRPMAPLAQGMLPGQRPGQGPGLVQGRGRSRFQQRERELVEGLGVGLAEPGSIGHDQVVADPFEGLRSAPHGNGIPVCRDRPGRVARGGGLAGPAQGRVEVVRIQPHLPAEAVAGVVGLDDVTAQGSPQPGDDGMDRRCRELDCGVAPDQVEEHVRRDDMAAALEQHGEHVPRPLAAGRGLTACSVDEQRSQNADTHPPMQSQDGCVSRPNCRDVAQPQPISWRCPSVPRKATRQVADPGSTQPVTSSAAAGGARALRVRSVQVGVAVPAGQARSWT